MDRIQFIERYLEVNALAETTLVIFFLGRVGDRHPTTEPHAIAELTGQIQGASGSLAR